MSALSDTGFAKVNLALHVRGRLPDGRHRLETLFVFCEDGDELGFALADEISLDIDGIDPSEIEGDNLVLRAARALREAVGSPQGAHIRLSKRLPIAAGVGGGSADAAATLRSLSRLWGADPAILGGIAPLLGADVPACLLSTACRGSGAGDEIRPVNLPGMAGTPILLVNPRIRLSTGDVFAGWDGLDRGPLGEWRGGRNDLQPQAIQLVPEIGDILDWFGAQRGANFVRMSGSGATCFALFDDEASRDRAAAAVPSRWWHLATRLR